MSTTKTIYIIPANGPKRYLPATHVAPAVIRATPASDCRLRNAYTVRKRVHENETEAYTRAKQPALSPIYQRVPISSPPQQIRPKTEQSIAKRRQDKDSLDITDVCEILQPASRPGAVRKRERLTHLTPEEKLNRRKLKNRVAAQTARDRKKDRTQKLEHAVKLLLEENKQLRSDNTHLRNENAQLRQCQSATVNGVPNESVVALPQSTASLPTLSLDAFGSAASVSEPLPWERASSSTMALNAINRRRMPQQRTMPPPTAMALCLLTISAIMSICNRSSTTYSPTTSWTSTNSAMTSSKRSTLRPPLPRHRRSRPLAKALRAIMIAADPPRSHRKHASRRRLPHLSHCTMRMPKR
jgi:hypothetical protein